MRIQCQIEIVLNNGGDTFDITHLKSNQRWNMLKCYESLVSIWNLNLVNQNWISSGNSLYSGSNRKRHKLILLFEFGGRYGFRDLIWFTLIWDDSEWFDE